MSARELTQVFQKLRQRPITLGQGARAKVNRARDGCILGNDLPLYRHGKIEQRLLESRIPFALAHRQYVVDLALSWRRHTKWSQVAIPLTVERTALVKNRRADDTDTEGDTGAGAVDAVEVVKHRVIGELHVFCRIPFVELDAVYGADVLNVRRVTAEHSGIDGKYFLVFGDAEDQLIIGTIEAR